MDISRRKLLLRAMKEDATFVRKYLSALQRQENRSTASCISFAMGSYISQFVYEGQRQLRKVDPAAALEFSVSAEQILVRSRNSLKMFEDTKLGVDGLQSLFWNEIVPAHREYFVSKLRFSWLERFVKDVGIYRYNGKVLATTHAASFSLGLEASSIHSKNLSDDVFATMSEYGSYFAHFGDMEDPTQTAFPDYLLPTQFAQDGEDYRADELYRKVFNGSGTPGLNATLLFLLGHLNFINEIVGAGSNIAAPSYSVFKIRFLGIYQIVRSLKALYGNDKNRLTPASVRAIESVIQHPTAVLLASDGLRYLRNSFTHYDVDSRINLKLLSEDALSSSLLAATLGVSDAETFGEELDAFISVSAEIMNDWM